MKTRPSLECVPQNAWVGAMGLSLAFLFFSFFSYSLNGVPHAEKSGQHSVVHFVLKAKVANAAHIFPCAVLEYIFVW
jgi:hypothetical protein